MAEIVHGETLPILWGLHTQATPTVVPPQLTQQPHHQTQQHSTVLATRHVSLPICLNKDLKESASVSATGPIAPGTGPFYSSPQSSHAQKRQPSVHDKTTTVTGDGVEPG